MKRNLYQTIVALALGIIAVCGSFISIRAQQLPDEAALPNGKGAWVVEQKFKTSIGGAYIPGIIYVVIQSDGVVFHRKFFDSSQPATPWCRDKFTAKEMSGIKSAVANSKPGAWDGNYGPFISTLGPFTAITLTMRDARGKAVEYKTTLWRYYDLPPGIDKLIRETEIAGDIAFSNCAESSPGNSVTGTKENGATLYAVNKAGDLLWYNHSGFQIGDAVWANNGSAKKVGDEWDGNTKIFKGDPAGRDGIIYTVSREGWLSWYKHNGHASGSGDWETPKNVGTGFNGRFVFSGGGGVIYLIDNEGAVYWYKHTGYKTGEKTWVNNGKGIRIAAGENWKNARFVFAGGSGVIYLIDEKGNLYWQKHLGFQGGAASWSEPKKTGSGWGGLQQVFAGGDGIIYAVQMDGTLLWQKHLDPENGSSKWAKGGAASRIGSSWNFKFVF